MLFCVLDVFLFVDEATIRIIYFFCFLMSLFSYIFFSKHKFTYIYIYIYIDRYMFSLSFVVETTVF